tara:strand:+ start:6221 stop:6499 length:279 start_codon:yes stop_codon:yes gene_type:complete
MKNKTMWRCWFTQIEELAVVKVDAGHVYYVNPVDEELRTLKSSRHEQWFDTKAEAMAHLISAHKKKIEHFKMKLHNAELALARAEKEVGDGE